jgi:hypothetical protein
MEHGMYLLGALAAAIGQWTKSHPRINNAYPQAVMVLVGLVWYAGNHGGPKGDPHGFAAVFTAWADWIEGAIPTLLALPGAASLVGLIPAMKTRTQPNP